MKMTNWVGLGLLALGAAAGGCGGGGGGENGGTGGTSGTTCTTLPPLTLTADSKIGFVQLYEASGLWRTANTNSIVSEAQARGYNLMYKPGTTDAAEEQVAVSRGGRAARQLGGP